MDRKFGCRSEKYSDTVSRETVNSDGSLGNRNSNTKSPSGLHSRGFRWGKGRYQGQMTVFSCSAPAKNFSISCSDTVNLSKADFKITD